MPTQTQPLPNSSVSNSVTGKLSLRDRVLHGVKWEFAGQMFSQVWRLGTNLILTRILMPEAFGAMALVFSIIFAIRMVSDIGVRDAVIHNERGDCPEFLNTVWTILIIRGFILWGVIVAIASPFARFYDEPQLTWLLPIVGLMCVARGFASTSILTASRHILARWNVTILVCGNIAGTVSMVILALITRSVLALAIGNVVNAVVFTAVSYQFGEHRGHRFCWDRDAAAAVSAFGRWIIPSSALTILLQQGDKLILGKLVSSSTLGLYSIGSNLAGLPMMIFDRLTNTVLQPLYAKTRDLSTDDAHSKIRRFRMALLASLLPILWVFIFGSYWVFRILYTDEFLEAHKFCSITALGISFRLCTDMGPIFQAHGQAEKHFRIMLVRCIIMLTSMFVGYNIGEYMGLIWGLAVSPLIYYPYQAWMYRKLGKWQPEIDFSGIAICLIASGIYFTFLN